VQQSGFTVVRIVIRLLKNAKTKTEQKINETKFGFFEPSTLEIILSFLVAEKKLIEIKAQLRNDNLNERSLVVS